jgi:hypothetical protein
MVQCDSRLFERRKSWVRQISVAIISDARPSIDRAPHRSTALAIQWALRGLPIRPKSPAGRIDLTVVRPPSGSGFYARISIGAGLLETLPSIAPKVSLIAGLVAC